jgi:hypothetical protein
MSVSAIRYYERMQTLPSISTRPIDPIWDSTCNLPPQCVQHALTRPISFRVLSKVEVNTISPTYIIPNETFQSPSPMATPLQIVTTSAVQPTPQGSSCHNSWCMHLIVCFLTGQSNVLARLQALFPTSPSASNSDTSKGLPPPPRTSSRLIPRVPKSLKVRIVTYVYLSYSHTLVLAF